MFRAIDVIQKKRDGQELTAEEIDFFVSGFGRGAIPDYQASALAMAVYFRGMSAAETLRLTRSMMLNGAVLDLSELAGPKVDKHSTGGVGDKTSLVAAPLAAACGVFVPMISGRSLGHTGGTLDKLESIPRFRVSLSLGEFRSVLHQCGLSYIGQTPDIAPVDRMLYALRDVTATVESLPLIAASIMSKKLAEGIDGLVLDVKCGDGAFLPRLEDARALAHSMLAIGHGEGKRIAALVTNMDQPLGRAVGNALEVAECIETLKGRGPRDLASLSIELAAWMIYLGALAPSIDAARARAREALKSGAGIEKLRQVIDWQEGDPRVCDDLSLLPKAAETIAVRAPRDGRVKRIACRIIGQASMLLGAGRSTVTSRIDPAVGIVLHKKIGDLVIDQEPLLTLHVNDRQPLQRCLDLLDHAFDIEREAPPVAPLVREVILPDEK
ncbi:MAG: thymidine phosphorylase [Vicinamibacteria bacterium]|nr:thymidine phosphorylase [Vicinamibacteria bacterium]